MVTRALIHSSVWHRSGVSRAHKQRGERRFPEHLGKNQAFDLGFLTNDGRKDSGILGRENGLREG